MQWDKIANMLIFSLMWLRVISNPHKTYSRNLRFPGVMRQKWYFRDSKVAKNLRGDGEVPGNKRATERKKSKKSECKLYPKPWMTANLHMHTGEHREPSEKSGKNKRRAYLWKIELHWKKFESLLHFFTKAIYSPVYRAGCRKLNCFCI